MKKFLFTIVFFILFSVFSVKAQNNNIVLDTLIKPNDSVTVVGLTSNTFESGSIAAIYSRKDKQGKIEPIIYYPLSETCSFIFTDYFQYTQRFSASFSDQNQHLKPGDYFVVIERGSDHVILSDYFYFSVSPTELPTEMFSLISVVNKDNIITVAASTTHNFIFGDTINIYKDGDVPKEVAPIRFSYLDGKSHVCETYRELSPGKYYAVIRGIRGTTDTTKVKELSERIYFTIPMANETPMPTIPVETTVAEATPTPEAFSTEKISTMSAANFSFPVSAPSVEPHNGNTILFIVLGIVAGCGILILVIVLCIKKFSKN